MLLRIALFTLLIGKLCAGCLAEFKAGYFDFSDKKLQRVFNRGGIDLQVAASVPLWRCLQLYGSVEYFERHGRSLCFGQSTKFQAVPLSLGIKPVLKLDEMFLVYLTAGPRYFFVNVRSHSEYIPNNINRNGLGAFVGGGFNARYGCFFIDIFGEYSWKRLRFHDHCDNVYGRHVSIGGGTFGGGIGHVF